MCHREVPGRARRGGTPGGPTDVAEVTAPATDLSDLQQAADLHVGGDHLVFATDGTVTGCGFSGPARGHLLDLYGHLFAG